MVLISTIPRACRDVEMNSLPDSLLFLRHSGRHNLDVVVSLFVMSLSGSFVTKTAARCTIKHCLNRCSRVELGRLSLIKYNADGAS